MIVTYNSFLAFFGSALVGVVVVRFELAGREIRNKHHERQPFYMRLTRRDPPRSAFARLISRVVGIVGFFGAGCQAMYKAAAGREG